jgi:hypothetical protein
MQFENPKPCCLLELLTILSAYLDLTWFINKLYDYLPIVFLYLHVAYFLFCFCFFLYLYIFIWENVRFCNNTVSCIVSSVPIPWYFRISKTKLKVSRKLKYLARFRFSVIERTWISAGICIFTKLEKAISFKNINNLRSQILIAWLGDCHPLHPLSSADPHTEPSHQLILTQSLVISWSSHSLVISRPSHRA